MYIICILFCYTLPFLHYLILNLWDNVFIFIICTTLNNISYNIKLYNYIKYII